MARLERPPIGLDRHLIGWEPLSGPRTVGAGGTQAIGGFVQTTGSPFGLWRIKLIFAPMDGAMERDFLGWVTALHGGANASAWTFRDPSRMSLIETGINAPDWPEPAVSWSNGQNWSNGMPWEVTPPSVPMAAAAAKGDTEVVLQSVFWGKAAGRGTLIGFYPFHFGMYRISGVLGGGRYRIWPPLRRAVGVDDFATLDPVLAIRPEGEDAASIARDAPYLEGSSLIAVEVRDDEVLQYFAD